MQVWKLLMYCICLPEMLYTDKFNILQHVLKLFALTMHTTCQKMHKWRIIKGCIAKRLTGIAVA